MPNPLGIVPSGNPKVLIVARLEHLAPKERDISKVISSNGII